MAIFVNDDSKISFPYNDAPISPSEIIGKNVGKLTFNKIMAAGDVVTASIQCKNGDELKEGVAIFEFNRKVKKISGLRFYF